MIKALSFKSTQLPGHNKSAIIVPCFKEAKRLNINKYKESLKNFSSVVYLIDDASPDGTFDVLNKLAKSSPDRFIAIKNPVNTGKGETVRQGFQMALDKGFKHIGFLDADLAVDFKEIPTFLKIMDNNPEINSVIGVRSRLAGHQIDRSLPKYLLQRIIAKMGNVMFSPNVTDTQCGAKMFDAKALKPVVKEPFISRWLFDQELLIRLSRLKENIGKNWLFEYPVEKWTEYGDSHIKISSYTRSLKDYFKILKKYGLKR